jgi:hypothetical protein
LRNDASCREDVKAVVNIILQKHDEYNLQTLNYDRLPNMGLLSGEPLNWLRGEVGAGSILLPRGRCARIAVLLSGYSPAQLFVLKGGCPSLVADSAASGMR